MMSFMFNKYRTKVIHIHCVYKYKVEHIVASNDKNPRTVDGKIFVGINFRGLNF